METGSWWACGSKPWLERWRGLGGGAGLSGGRAGCRFGGGSGAAGIRVRGWPRMLKLPRRADGDGDGAAGMRRPSPPSGRRCSSQPADSPAGS